MSEAAPQPKRRRWWHYLTQFSLRTLLALVTLAAVACWWLLMPEAREEELAGKYLKLRRDVRVNEAAPGNLPADDDRRYVSHGAWRVRDQHGDLLIDGRYSGNERHDKWTIYHTSGHKAAEGLVFRGVRSGVWRTWDEEGNRRSEVTYKVVERADRPLPVPRPFVNTVIPVVGMINLPLAQFGGGGIMGGGSSLPMWPPGLDSIRHGPARLWYASGQLHCEGQYKDDLREGPWMFYDEQGRVTSQGSYRVGIRDGKWQIADRDSSQPQSREYITGLPKEDVKRLIAQLGEDLARGGIHRKLAAAKRLEQLGAPAVPCLIQALGSTNPEVQLLSLRALTRLNALPVDALPKAAALVDHPDPRLALRAKLALYLAEPQRRSRLFLDLMQSLRTAGDELAIEAHLAMYRADPDRSLAFLATLIERMGAARAESPQMPSGREDDASQIAELGWDVVPQLNAIYPQASREARWFSVVVLMKLVSQSPPTRIENSPGNFTAHWDIPEQAQPLLARALADSDPRVRETAKLVGKHNGSGYLGPNLGGRGLGGGGGFF